MSDTETPKRSVEQQNSVPPSSPSAFGGRSDVESDAEQGSHGSPVTPARIEGSTKEEMIALYRKQERVLTRYKARFSEVTMAKFLYINTGDHCNEDTINGTKQPWFTLPCVCICCGSIFVKTIQF